MIKSMTGFGRFEMTDTEHKITIEMKSVNHRYFEPTIKMPKKLNIYENEIRKTLKNYITRGKVDVYITYEDYSENKFCLKYNEELADEYMNIFNYMSEQFGIKNDVSITNLSRYPEIITMEEKKSNNEMMWNYIHNALVNACTQFVDSRVTEGETLKQDMLGKLEIMLDLVEKIETRNPQILEEYKVKISSKIHELMEDVNIDDARLATEVTIFADKICVDEETVRLKNHIKTTKDTLQEGGAVGRKLDFIAQEMNREANTILSKANDLETSNWAIGLKTEIEKVREQIQNIE